ncbi:putative pectinesterase [Rosa chinensis]|uniref:Pectinesterase n=1 Tax=Rosa chinensis TaxID=74649 RepID=A0A2P6PFV7_ROSCH|nr:putative pectinesterase [Rosa chinensis]
MSSADQMVFYRCHIDAFQDSLYVYANRQFYRECNIYGTVDFIFGNLAVVLQNCKVFPKVPMVGQQNTITAQGKIDPNQNTGIAFQNCTISPFGDLSSVKTYLRRPWKNYSTTVYMQTFMGSLIHPDGWLPWVGTTAPEPMTINLFNYQTFNKNTSLPTTAMTINQPKIQNIPNYQPIINNPSSMTINQPKIQYLGSGLKP